MFEEGAHKKRTGTVVRHLNYTIVRFTSYGKVDLSKSQAIRYSDEKDSADFVNPVFPANLFSSRRAEPVR